jgi:predicted ATPase
MKLDTFSVKHYKSLSDVTVKFDPNVTVIVGANAVGKSNFVDAMRFLRDSHALGPGQAFRRRGGIDSVLALDVARDVQVEFQITCVTSPTNPRYGLTLVTGQQGDGWNSKNPSLGEPDVGQFVTSWQFSVANLQRLRDRNAYTDDGEKPLNEDGSNWVSVLYKVSVSPGGEAILERIYEVMRFVIPGFSRVTVNAVGKVRVPQFEFIHDSPSVASHWFEPEQLSDGTLRLFVLLLALYQSTPPDLLVIEEPEQMISPVGLCALADTLKEVGDVTQLVITTHSPDLVKRFAPEQIRVASMRNGVTSITGLHRNQIEAVNEGLFGLDEFMAGEGLRPSDLSADAP